MAHGFEKCFKRKNSDNWNVSKIGAILEIYVWCNALCRHIQAACVRDKMPPLALKKKETYK